MAISQISNGSLRIAAQAPPSAGGAPKSILARFFGTAKAASSGSAQEMRSPLSGRAQQTSGTGTTSSKGMGTRLLDFLKTVYSWMTEPAAGKISHNVAAALQSKMTQINVLCKAYQNPVASSAHDHRATANVGNHASAGNVSLNAARPLRTNTQLKSDRLKVQAMRNGPAKQRQLREMLTEVKERRQGEGIAKLNALDANIMASGYATGAPWRAANDPSLGKK